MIAAAKTKATPGVFHAMPDAEYRALDALSNSDLMAWAKGEAMGKIDERNARIGTAVHAKILEPEVAKAKIVGLAPKQKRASYEGPDDVWVFSYSEHQTVEGCYESALSHPDYSQIIKHAHANRNMCELAVVWECPHTGILRKALLDLHTDAWLYDIKTTQSDMDDFEKSIIKFFYHIQAATYLQASRAAGLELKGFRFAPICKRKDMGFPCWIQEIDESLLRAGWKDNELLMNLYARYGQETTNENQ